MTKHIASKDMTVVGIDLAKSSFHVHGVDDEGGAREQESQPQAIGHHDGQFAQLLGRDGSLWRGTLLGA